MPCEHGPIRARRHKKPKEQRTHSKEHISGWCRSTKHQTPHTERFCTSLPSLDAPPTVGEVACSTQCVSFAKAFITSYGPSSFLPRQILPLTQAPCTPALAHAPSLDTDRNARAPTSLRSISFCAIWDCISPSSSSGSRQIMTQLGDNWAGGSFRDIP